MRQRLCWRLWDFSDFGQPVHEVSGGQKKRVALVRVLLEPVDILVLDEPTNHLDHQMSDWLEETLIRYRGTLVMVTHDRYFLDRVVTRIAEVDKGQIYSYPGSYSKFVELKEQRLNMEQATERKRQSICGRNWSGWQEAPEPGPQSRRHISSELRQCRKSRLRYRKVRLRCLPWHPGWEERQLKRKG